MNFLLLSRNCPLIAFTLAFGLPDCYAGLLFLEIINFMNQRIHHSFIHSFIHLFIYSFKAPLLPELKLLLAVHPVAAVTVGLVL